MKGVILSLICSLSMAMIPTVVVADGVPQVMSLQKGSVLRGHFTQERSLQGFQAPLKSDGSFVVAAGQGLIWKVEKPFATTTIITPAGLVQNAQGSETLRLTSTQIPFVAKLYDMLSGTMTGDLTGLKQQFNVVMSGTAQNWSLTLTPKLAANSSAGGDQAMPIQDLVLSGDHFVQSVEIHRPNGDKDVLHFAGQHVETASLSADEQDLLSGAAHP